MGKKGPRRDAQLRDRGGVRYGVLERGGSGGRQDARSAEAGGGQCGARVGDEGVWHVGRAWRVWAGRPRWEMGWAQGE
jgi:hypothetical protein